MKRRSQTREACNLTATAVDMVSLKLDEVCISRGIFQNMLVLSELDAWAAAFCGMFFRNSLTLMTSSLETKLHFIFWSINNLAKIPKMRHFAAVLWDKTSISEFNKEPVARMKVLQATIPHLQPPLRLCWSQLISNLTVRDGGKREPNTSQKLDWAEILIVFY